jgi:putative SOS response-associated peptidase YedK
MCYSINALSELLELAKLQKIRNYPDEYVPLGKVSGFAYPRLPVITQDNPREIRLFKWGLIPAWAKDEKVAELAKIRLRRIRSWNTFKIQKNECR